MNIIITPENSEDSLRKLVSRVDAVKPNAKKEPHLVPMYIFIKLCQKHKKQMNIEYTEDKCRVMFPFLERKSDEKILGWLCFSNTGPHLTTLEYFTGFKPYENQSENEAPLDRPSIVITGGQTLCGEESDPGNGFPNIRVKLITSEHPFAFGSDLWELNSINKLLSEIIEINKEFEFD